VARPARSPPPPGAGTELQRFEGHAALQGSAAGRRRSQPFLRVPAEGPGTAIRPVEGAQRRRPRQPAGEAVKQRELFNRVYRL
jgi:hypothetical protein